MCFGSGYGVLAGEYPLALVGCKGAVRGGLHDQSNRGQPARAQRDGGGLAARLGGFSVTALR